VLNSKKCNDNDNNNNNNNNNNFNYYELFTISSIRMEFILPELDLITALHTSLSGKLNFIVAFFYFLSHGQQPLMGQGLLGIKASRSHSDPPHLVGFLWTSDHADAETCT
jgi:hypothetical protein